MVSLRLVGVVLAVVGSLSCITACAAVQLNTFQGKDVFDRVVTKADAGNWRSLPIGELMGKVAKQLEGTPYQANTLELSPSQETCSVNLKGLDCVTFFETTLDMSRMLKKGGRTPEDLLRAVAFTRYRGGTPGDYSTRLHYTSDWFIDNETKHVVRILSDLPGTEDFRPKVGFMSSHPQLYPQLQTHPELIAKLKATEDAINKRTMKFVPLNKLAGAEPFLKTGDIVGICTSTPGLDIAHTGLIMRTKDGVAHFMDASSKKGVDKVTIESGSISQTLTNFKHATGVMFARPLEP